MFVLTSGSRTSGSILNQSQLNLASSTQQQITVPRKERTTRSFSILLRKTEWFFIVVFHTRKLKKSTLVLRQSIGLYRQCVDHRECKVSSPPAIFAVPL